MHAFTKLVSGLLLVTIQLTAQDKLPAIRSYFSFIGQHDLFNGNVLLAENNKVLTLYSGGYANEREHKRNHPSSRFNLASISKIFTSTAILQLRDKGKLKLEDDFSHISPPSLLKALPSGTCLHIRPVCPTWSLPMQPLKRMQIR